jgi:Family of unknown function (DUF6174)
MRYSHIICCAFILAATCGAANGQELEGYLVTDERPQQGHAGVGMNGRETWLINNYQNYVYTLEQACYCALPKQARVYVIAGKVVKVDDIKTGRGYKDAKMLSNFRTVPGYLELIDELVSRHPDSLSIRYNRYLGYPELIKADLSYHMADEEIDYRIGDLKFLKRR